MDHAMKQGLQRLGKYGAMNGYGTFGAECKPGFYELKVLGYPTGQCVPSSGTLIEAVQGATAGAFASGVATSPATIQAGRAAAGQALGEKIINFYANQPVLAWSGTAAIAAFVVYGGMKFLRGG